MKQFPKLTSAIAIFLCLTACIEAPKPPTWVDPTPSPSQSISDNTSTPTDASDTDQSPSESSPTIQSPTPETTASETQSATPTTTADPNVDVDGDGYTKNQGDCQPRDPQAYPGAIDQPYDGRDDNCNGFQDHVEIILGAGLNEGSDALFSRMDGNEKTAYGEDGTIYVADTSLCRIRSIKNGIIQTLVGNGECRVAGDGLPGTEASIWLPDDLAIDDTNQRLYYASRGEIWYLDLVTNTAHYFIGNQDGETPVDGSYHSESYLYARAMAYESFYNTLYFSSNGAIFTYQVYDNVTERIYIEAGNQNVGNTPIEGPANETILGRIEDMQVTPIGLSIFYTMTSGSNANQQARIASISEGQVKFLAGGEDNCFDGEAYATGNYDLAPYQESVIDMPADEVILCNPKGITTHDEQSFYFVDEYNVYKYDSTSDTVTRVLQDGDAIAGVSGSSFVAHCEGSPADCNVEYPTSIFYDNKGENIYWTEKYNQTLKKMNIENEYITRVAGYGPYGFIQGSVDTALIGSPTSIALHIDEKTGNEHLYLTDVAHNVIYEIVDDELKIISGVLGTEEYAGTGIAASGASLNDPEHLEITPEGALLFFNDKYRIQQIYNGTLETIAGTGDLGSEGDGGLAKEAQLGYNGPMAYVPSLDSLFFRQLFNGDSIRQITFSNNEAGLIDTAFRFPLTLSVDTVSGTDEVELNAPIEMVASQNYLYYSTRYPSAIIRFNGNEHEILALEHEAELVIPKLDCAPSYLALDPNNLVHYLCSTGTGIWRLTESGSVKVMGSEDVRKFTENSSTSAQAPPYGEILFSWNGDLIVANRNTRNLLRVSF